MRRDESPSPLEYMHPQGGVQSALVLGRACPELLCPNREEDGGRLFDLVVLAPDEGECATREWLRAACKRAAQELAVDGFVYLLAPVRWRGRIARQLLALGLEQGDSFAHLYRWADSEFILPLTPAPVRYALARLVHAHPLKSSLARIGFHLPARIRQEASLAWPAAGIAFRRPGGRDLFQWFNRGMGNAAAGAAPLLRMSWRGRQGPVLLYGFAPGADNPAVIGKISPGGRDQLACEADRLERLGERARQAGVQVPQRLDFDHDGEPALLLMTALPGKRADRLLQEAPQSFPALVREVAGWLAGWHARTVRLRPLEAGRLDQFVFAPARRLAPELQQGEAYVGWLLECFERLVGQPAPRVAAHNDLTLANVLVDQDGALGIVDWEKAEADGWPLVDFFYSVVDAAMNAQAGASPARPGLRRAAFRDLFTPGGTYTALCASLQEQIASSAQVSPEFARLCFHVCWLEHAGHEQQSAVPGQARPFLDVLQEVVLGRDQLI